MGASNDKQAVLERAITRAIEGGWKPPLASFAYDQGDLIFFDDNDETFIDVNTVIFNHDFAKALWGGEDGYYAEDYAEFQITDGHSPFDPQSEPDEQIHYAVARTYRNVRQPKWEGHLQQMVAADDPIAYLGEHL